MRCARRWRLLLAAGLAFVGVAHAMTLQEVFAEPEQQQRKVLGDTVGRWFLAEEFTRIEDLADKARERKLRTSSGLWVIGLVYGGIDDVANYGVVKDDAGWDRLEAIAQRWLRARPASVTARIAYAGILENRAWFYRGGGYARTVSDEQFADFYRQIAKAKQYQLSIREVGNVDPNWHMQYLAILRLERDGKRAEFEQAFQQAIEAFPDYYPTYFEAVTYYLPKWKGDAYEVERFARRVMKSRDARSGKMLYARIYWYTSQNQFKSAIFLTSVAHWDDMRAGFEAILAEYPDQWNINHYAKFACLVGDQETTQEAFGMLKGEPIKAAWDSDDEFRRCERFAGRDSI